MNERQFDHKGGVYREGRPAYPPALFECLRGRPNNCVNLQVGVK